MISELPNVPTLRQVLEEYLRNRKPKPKTQYIYRNWVERCIGDWLDMRVTDISAEMVIARHRELCEGTRGKGDGSHYKPNQKTDRKGAPTQANRVMSVLRSLLYYAKIRYSIRDDQMVQNPVNHLRVLKHWAPERNKIEHFVEEHELQPWLRAVQNYKNQTVSEYLLLLVLTGLRPGEARQLTWNDIDFENRVIYIGWSKRGGEFTTKSGRGIRIPMSRFVEWMLLRRLANSKSIWVFEGRRHGGRRTIKGPGPIHDSHKAISIISESCGVKFTSHDLRRTFINLMTHPYVGLDPDKAGRFLNHAPETVTDRSYLTVNVELLRPYYERLSHLVVREMNLPSMQIGEFNAHNKQSPDEPIDCEVVAVL